MLLEYPPGSRLDVDALAREHDVSRTPVRSVIQRLEQEGLAVTRHGVGTTVAEIDFSQINAAMQFRMHLALLIGTLDPRPAREGVAEHIEQLARDFAGLTEPEFHKEFARFDVQLHDWKCELIGNNLLRRTYDQMYYRTVRAWFHFLPRMSWETERDNLLQDMTQTVSAIRRGDIVAVGFVTRNAISAGLLRLHDLIEEVEGRN